MDYVKYKEIFDNHVVIDNVTEFVHSLIDSNDKAKRLMSGFKIISLEARIASKYLTSTNIKFGDAVEDIFKEYLKDKGVTFLPRDFVKDKDCDQIFTYNGIIYLIEQKIRDDHDSSKKEGQIENYFIKKEAIAKQASDYYTCCWFIDPDFQKNKNYYMSVLNEDELYYGEKIIVFLREKVFHDNRCDNFFEELSEAIEKYSREFSLLSLVNLTIDYHNFTTTQLYRLLKTRSLINQVAKIFFNGNIPFEEIYDYIDHRSRVKCTDEFKQLLEEYMNQ